MNRQELLRTAEDLRENRDITAAVVDKGFAGDDDQDIINVRARGLTWDIQRLVRYEDFLMGRHVSENEDGELEITLRP